MVGVSASVNFLLHHKAQKFSSGTGSPGWSRKKGHKTVVVVVIISERGSDNAHWANPVMASVLGGQYPPTPKVRSGRDCLFVALNRAKSLLDRATDQANRTKLYFDRLTEIRVLLVDLDNHTEQSSARSRDAVTANERSRRVLRTVLVRNDNKWI